MYNELAIPLAIVIMLITSVFAKDPDRFIQSFTFEKPSVYQVVQKD